MDNRGGIDIDRPCLKTDKGFLGGGEPFMARITEKQKGRKDMTTPPEGAGGRKSHTALEWHLFGAC